MVRIDFIKDVQKFGEIEVQISSSECTVINYYDFLCISLFLLGIWAIMTVIFSGMS